MGDGRAKSTSGSSVASNRSGRGGGCLPRTADRCLTPRSIDNAHIYIRSACERSKDPASIRLIRQALDYGVDSYFLSLSLSRRRACLPSISPFASSVTDLHSSGSRKTSQQRSKYDKTTGKTSALGCTPSLKIRSDNVPPSFFLPCLKFVFRSPLSALSNQHPHTGRRESLTHVVEPWSPERRLQLSQPAKGEAEGADGVLAW